MLRPSPRPLRTRLNRTKMPNALSYACRFDPRRLGLATPAFAGECPAGQMRADATKPSTAAAKAVTNKVLSMIDLADEKVALRAI